MKCIIKNCPKAIKFPTETICQGKAKHCQDIPSQHCLLKQIAEKCEQIQNEWSEELLKYPDKYKFFKSGRSDAGREILKMLEIEEINQ